MRRLQVFTHSENFLDGLRNLSTGKKKRRLDELNDVDFVQSEIVMTLLVRGRLFHYKAFYTLHLTQS